MGAQHVVPRDCMGRGVSVESPSHRLWHSLGRACSAGKVTCPQLRSGIPNTLNMSFRLICRPIPPLCSVLPAGETKVSPPVVPHHVVHHAASTMLHPPCCITASTMLHHVVHHAVAVAQLVEYCTGPSHASFWCLQSQRVLLLGWQQLPSVVP